MNYNKIQAFIKDFILSILSLIKIVLQSRIFLSRAKPALPPSRECFILGNGPSLADSIVRSSPFFKDKDLVCVNFFPDTPFYKQLKPRYYITSAPEFWLKNVSDIWETARRNFFENLKNNTDWDIIFLIPIIAKKQKEWQNILSENSHIKITFYNTTPVEGYKWFRHCCFKAGLGMPRPHNVITPALMQMLRFGYKSIYLLGADHSWLPDIKVDNENRVFTLHRHFYDKDTAGPVTMKNLQMGDRKLHEVLHKFYHTFAGYFIIKDFADSLKAHIYNATPGSFIDAFERKELQ